MAANAIRENPSSQLYMMWTGEEIKLASQDQIGDEVERVQAEIRRLNDEMVQLVRRMSILNDNASGKASTAEMGEESGQLKARIAALHEYQGALRISWRKKEGFEN